MLIQINRDPRCTKHSFNILQFITCTQTCTIFTIINLLSDIATEFFNTIINNQWNVLLCNIYVMCYGRNGLSSNTVQEDVVEHRHCK